MSELESMAHGPARSYRCSSCSRRFLAFGEEAGRKIFCACSAPLVAHALPRGLYELHSSTAEGARATSPGSAPMPKEPDVGYGASHGYDVAHGGPSGPGDAPADVPETPS